ncbi:hypothetical protein ACHAP6_001542 [Verticillium nonalfalfae]
MYCYFCRTCGTRLLHTTPSKNVVSVKGGCLEGLDWTKAIHIWTKSAMVPIPEGSESHSEETSLTTDYGELQDELDQPTDLRGSGEYEGQESFRGASVVVVGEGEAPPAPVSGACELSG